MRSVLRLLWLIPALALPATAGAKTEPTPPAVDTGKIINDSYNFLKNREPEMTDTEYALYDKVVSLLATNPDYAVKLLETMLGEQKNNVSPAFEFVLGNAFYSTSKLDLAIIHLTKAVEKYPDFQRAWVNLGMAQYTLQRHADAARSLQKGISLGDRTASTYGVLGYCLFKTDNVLGSESAYAEAYSLDPANADWIQALVELHFAGGEYRRAEALMRQLLRQRPTEARYWMMQASILVAAQRPVDAIAILETGARLKVLDQPAVLLLGDLYVQQKFHPEAVATYQAVFTSSPATGAERLLKYAQSLVATGQLVRAEQILQDLPAQPAKAAQVLVWETRAALYSARKDPARTRDALEQLLQIEPFHGNALVTLAGLQRAAGENALARMLLEQAAQLDDHAYPANLELAKMAFDAKDYSRSIAHLRRAIGIQHSTALQDFLDQVTALAPPTHENQL